MSKQMNMPKLRFSGFGTEWETYSLKQISTKNISYGVVQTGDRDLTVPCVRVVDLTSGELVKERFIKTSEAISQSYKKTILEKNELMIALRGVIGLTRAVGDDLVGCNLTRGIARVAPNKKKFISTYIEQVLNSPKSALRFDQLKNGSALKEISIGELNKYPVSCPTLPEQQKIASFLSKVDEKITLLTKKKEKLVEYKKGVMQQLFSGKWEEQDGQLTFIPPTLRFKADDGSEFPDWQTFGFYSLLNEVLDFRGRTPLKIGMDWGNGSILSLSANNVKNGYIDRDAENNVGSEELFTKWMGKVNLAKGDIIFTMEAPLGNALLLPDSEKYILSQRVVAFQTKQKLVNNNFLIQVIWGKEFQNTIAKLSTGTTAKGINQKSLKKINVSLPCLKEQTKIADFLSSLDKKIELTDSELEKAKEWKKGLLQQMFV